MVNDVYSPDEQETFLTGLESLDAMCREANGSGFSALDESSRLAIAEQLDRGAIRRYPERCSRALLPDAQGADRSRLLFIGSSVCRDSRVRRDARSLRTLPYAR